MALIKHYVRQYGHECWMEIYAADRKARKSHIERIRRIEAQSHLIAQKQNLYHPFNPKQPWEHCFQVLLRDQTFWQQSLIDPCQCKRDRPRASTSTPPKPPPQPQPTGDKSHKAKQVDENGNYITNAVGIELCKGFNRGTCTKSGVNGRCFQHPHLVHQCHVCLLNNHPACRHKTDSDKGGGKQKAKRGGPKTTKKKKQGNQQ